MPNRNILLTLFWFSFILLVTVFFVSNVVLTREFTFSGFNYAGKYSHPITIGKFPEVKHLQSKEIKVNFRIKVDSLSNYDNIFQTAAGNAGIRMELGGSGARSLGMVIGDKSAGLKGFLITKDLSFGKWHDISLQISNDKRIMVYLDNVLAVDEVSDTVTYDLSDIVIGTGFSRTRPLDGEIRDFKINCKLFYKLFPWGIAFLVQLLSGVLFILSLLLVKARIAGFLKTFKIKISIGYSVVESYCKRPGIKKYIKTIFLFFLPVLLIVFSVVKIFTYPHFTDSINLETLKYIGAFSLGFVGLLVVLDKHKKDLFLILIPFLLIIIAGQAYALFGLVLFVIASLALGFFLWTPFISDEHKLDKMGYACLIGFAVNSYAIWGALHFRVNYPGVYYLFLTAQIIVLRKTLFINLRGLIKKIPTYQLTPAQKILVFLMAVHVVYALVKNYCSDELVAHFYIPKVVGLDGVFNFSPHYTPAFFNLSFVSMGAHSALFLIGGGEFAIRLFHWAVFYITFFLFESFTRREYGKRVSLFATLTLATTPYFLMCLGCPFIDSLALFSALIMFINITSLLKNFTPRSILLFFALSCCALFFKLQIVLLLIPTVLIVFFKAVFAAYKRGDFKYLNASLLGCSFIFIFFFPILLHNWLITRNPVFPMYNDFFKSHFYAAEKPLPGFFKFNGSKLQWDSLYDITFKGDKYYVYGNNQFLFGISYFVFLWFIPVLFFCKEHKKQLLLTAGLFSSAVFLCYFITGPQMRYFITSAPMGAVVIGFLMNKLMSANSPGKLKFYILYAVFVGIFIVNFICGVNDSYLPSPYPLKEAITKDYSNSPRLQYWQDIKNFFEEVNKRYDRNTKALLFYSSAMYFADFNIEVLDWYNQFTAMEILRAYNTIDDLYYRVFKEQKFDILIITDNRPATFLDGFIDKGMVQKGYSSAGYSVYTPLKKF